MNPIPSTAFTETPRPVSRAPLPALPERKPKPLWMRVLQPVASLRLTVVLFVLSLVLVFVGTLAQMNAGNFTVIKEYFRSWWIVWVPLQLFVQFGQIFFGVDKDAHLTGSFPFPAGGILGGLLLVNLVAAHVVRFKLSWSRAGILILHAGLILLLVGELVTWHFAVEGNMTIAANGSSNFLEHREFSELIVTDSSAPNEDEVVAIPEGQLRSGQPIRNELLPFDVQVVQYMPNSTLAAAGPKNPATAGLGRRVAAIEQPEGSGTDTESKFNLPSAYVTFTRKGTGESLGTYMVSMWLDLADEQPQQITVDGKTYTVALRFKRTYKPYTIQLLKFHHEVYPGTNIPKDFASDIRLVDPSRHEQRETRVWMNHPLYYAGETFYQQGFLPGDTGTILQVVNNPGWMLPYLSCLMVAGGLLVHFGIKLTDFLVSVARQLGAPIVGVSWQQTGKSIRKEGSPASFLALVRLVARPVLQLFVVGFWPGRRTVKGVPNPPTYWLVPLLVVGAAALYLLGVALPARYDSKDFQLDEVGRLPVMENGRVKPLDTVARVDLMLISNRQDYTDKDGTTQPAIRWALDVMASRITPEAGEIAEGHKVFRIDNFEVLDLLKLQRRPGFRYALSEFGDKWKEIQKAADAAQKRDKSQRDLFDNKIMELAQHMTTYIGLAHVTETLRLVPPAKGEDPKAWQNLAAAFRNGKEANPAVMPLSRMFVAYASGNVERFNEELKDYQQLVSEKLPVSSNMARLEVFYNHFAPFYQCAILYGVVFVLACLSWLVWREPLRRAAFWLLVMTLVIHTTGILTRMYLQGRPPITNLYTTAVFIGWASVVFGVVLERIFRIGVASAVGGLLGFATALISHHLAAEGDTLEMMRAVLDTNFWLATHVTIINLGYAASFVAGTLGVAYLIAYVITKLTSPRQALQVQADGVQLDPLRVLGQMTYGIVCFAVLFSFTGTVLGGIWADQSWGRFWGWDPKENGALLIVIWSALILHARWAGLVKPFGVAVLAVLGNDITGFSWFGTNQLGVGLHAYGFNEHLAIGLRWFWVAQTVFLVGLFTLLGLANWLQRPRLPAAPAAG